MLVDRQNLVVSWIEERCIIAIKNRFQVSVSEPPCGAAAYVLFTRQQNVSFFKQRSHSTVSTYSIHDYFADEHQQPNYVPVTKASVYIPFAWFQMQVSSPAVSKDDD